MPNVNRKSCVKAAELPYRSMLKEIYPGLRKVNCKIDYTVVNFDVEQGRIIIRENPKYLNLNYLYISVLIWFIFRFIEKIEL